MVHRSSNPEPLKLKGKTIIASKNRFPVHYQFKTLGGKTIMMSNNAVGLSFTSSESNALKDQLEIATLNNVVDLMDDAFNGASKLEKVILNDGLETIGRNCFDGCSNITSIDIPNSVQTINEFAFANCRSLKDLAFEFYQYDTNDNSMPRIESIGDSILSQTNQQTSITFPESITSLDKIRPNALQNSNVNQICFLGMNKSSISQITSTKCFGLNKDCIIKTKDGQQCKFLASTGTLENDVFKRYGNAPISTNGQPNKMLLSRKIYEFRQQLYEWCIDPSQHDTKRFPSPHTCPIIIMFVDFKTSVASRNFLTNILENKSFQKWLAENLKCYIFLLDRNGNVAQNADSELIYFRSLDIANASGIKEFVHLSFIYDGNANQTTFIPGSIAEFQSLLVEYANLTKFDEFDSEQYESILSEPDPETIPTSGGDGEVIKNFHGSLPEWCSGNAIGNNTVWNIASNPMDFDLVSTPETTLVLAGCYDKNYPTNGPHSAVDGFINCVEKFSDTVVRLYDTNCYNTYKDEFLKGKKFRYFIFYEFSHGNTKVITIGISYSEIWDMFSSMTSHQRVYGIFDSCHSGSMLQTSSDPSKSNTTIDTDILSYLKYKFERRDKLLTALFGSAEAARTVKPKMILQSPTSAENYSYYHVGSNSCFMEPYEETYTNNKNVRFDEFWKLIHKNCLVQDQRGDAEPQQMVYPNESNSYYKNKIYF